jgi:hypothetical protein
MMPGFSRNCARTSSMMYCAVRPTALMASEEKRKISIAPSSAPTKTGTLARLMLVEAPAGGKHLPGIGEALRHDAVHRLQICGKEQEGGQRGGADGVALGQGLGGVAGGVQLVGLFADRVRLVRHFDDAAGVVGDGAEGVHGQDVGRGESMPMVAMAVP